MVELMRTNDPVRLSWAQAMLAGEGIETLVLDAFTSGIEGSIGALPRRLMVAEADLERARELLRQADPATAEGPDAP
ncbi:DUF2007 domain-containing protein [Geminicoccaceae bacterium 1502E]|nr:DUF2007 domain-containing protein [Geminicoccaceae bacterium 1502E]